MKDTNRVVRSWTNHAGGYFVCSHLGCQKKVNPTVFGHDSAAADGPTGTAWEFRTTITPAPAASLTATSKGSCAPASVLSAEAHQWVFDHLRGDRRRASWCGRCREDHPEGQHVEPDAS